VSQLFPARSIVDSSSNPWIHNLEPQYQKLLGMPVCDVVQEDSRRVILHYRARFCTPFGDVHYFICTLACFNCQLLLAALENQCAAVLRSQLHFLGPLCNATES